MSGFSRSAAAALSETVIRLSRNSPPSCSANASAASSESVVRPLRPRLLWCFPSALAASSESVVRPLTDRLPLCSASACAASAESEVRLPRCSSPSYCAAALAYSTVKPVALAGDSCPTATPDISTATASTHRTAHPPARQLHPTAGTVGASPTQSHEGVAAVLQSFPRSRPAGLAPSFNPERLEPCDSHGTAGGALGGEGVR